MTSTMYADVVQFTKTVIYKGNLICPEDSEKNLSLGTHITN